MPCPRPSCMANRRPCEGAGAGAGWRQLGGRAGACASRNGTVGKVAYVWTFILLKLCKRHSGHSHSSRRSAAAAAELAAAGLALAALGAVGSSCTLTLAHLQHDLQLLAVLHSAPTLPRAQNSPDLRSNCSPASYRHNGDSRQPQKPAQPADVGRRPGAPTTGAPPPAHAGRQSDSLHRHCLSPLTAGTGGCNRRHRRQVRAAAAEQAV